MDIKLGQPVVSTDGDQIGKVDSLAMDSHTKEIREIIVKQGMFLSTDRIMDRSMVERVGDDGTIYLNISSAQAEEMPPFVQDQYAIIREEELSHMPHAWGGGADPLPLFWAGAIPASGPVEQRTSTPNDNASFFDVAPLGPAPIENESNLSEDTVLISSGTDVVGSDGEKIGKVDEVLYGDGGSIAGLVIKAGFLFHHDVRVPADWIEAVTGETVQLNVTAEQAENGIA